MFYVEIFKNKKGGLSACLKANLGYAQRIISWDNYLIAELCNISVSALLSEPRIINL